jgi:hypothetical protein
MNSIELERTTSHRRLVMIRSRQVLAAGKASVN